MSNDIWETKGPNGKLWSILIFSDLWSPADYYSLLPFLVLKSSPDIFLRKLSYFASLLLWRLHKIVSLLFSHHIFSALCSLVLYWKKTLEFWHPITNSGGARHFCKHGWTMHVVLRPGSFMTSGKLLIQCALVSSHQDFQIFLCFIWGNQSFKRQGGNTVLLFLSFACPCVFPAA